MAAGSQDHGQSRQERISMPRKNTARSLRHVNWLLLSYTEQLDTFLAHQHCRQWLLWFGGKIMEKKNVEDKLQAVNNDFF